MDLMGGGIGNRSDVRLRRQLTLLADLDLDVAALQECKRRADDDSALLHLAEERFGMTGFLAESAHHGCHLAVFVRESAGLQVIEPRHERGYPYWHAVARVLVRAKGLPVPMYLASAHFAPSSLVIRLAKAAAFELIAQAGPLIPMGDINGMPLHDPDPRPSTRHPGHVQRKLDRSAAQALEDNGLVDVGARCADPTPSPPAALSGRSRGIAFPCSGGMTGLSVPRSACLARSRIAEMGAPGVLECDMAADSAFRSSLPRLPWSRPGPAACHARRAAGKLAALRSGASSDRPVQGSSRVGERSA